MIRNTNVLTGDFKSPTFNKESLKKTMQEINATQ